MSEPERDSRSQIVYRRIPPKLWDAGGPAAFLEGEGEGLSLFRGEVRTPAEVIRHAIDCAREKAQSSDRKTQRSGEHQLAKYGETVEEWIQNGWHVVELPASAFTERNYHFGQTEPDGHVEAFGDHDTFAIELADLAVEVQRDRILQADAPAEYIDD